MSIICYFDIWKGSVFLDRLIRVWGRQMLISWCKYGFDSTGLIINRDQRLGSLWDVPRALSNPLTGKVWLCGHTTCRKGVPHEPRFDNVCREEFHTLPQSFRLGTDVCIQCGYCVLDPLAPHQTQQVFDIWLLGSSGKSWATCYEPLILNICDLTWGNKQRKVMPLFIWSWIMFSLIVSQKLMRSLALYCLTFK